MKRTILFFIGLLSTSVIMAQDVTDALRYSMNEIEGTARFRAMGGAFGALGGDMSAVSINPASSAIFNTSNFSVSAGIFNTTNDVNYNIMGFNNPTNTTDDSYVDAHQFGAAFVFENGNSNSKWKNFALSVAYDRSRDFDDDWIASGTNNTSIDNYFLTSAQGNQFGTLKLLPGEFIEEAYADIGGLANGFQLQQAFLGYWSGIIDPVNLDNNTNDMETNYVSNIAPGTFDQTHLYSATGYNGKLAFNFATNYDDKVYLGVNLNAHFLNYERFTRFTETNGNTGSTVNNLVFENLLTTNGGGFSFQVGTIVKVTPEFRVGLSYDSPTWFRIDEELIQGINSNNADPEIGFISNVINVYPEYRLQTPGRLTGSLAYVFGNKGLISFDYAVKDYTNMKFRPTSDLLFSQINNNINDLFTTASTYRFGGEYRINQVSLRAGYRFEESPYKDSSRFGDLTGYSAGIGYNFGNMNLDLAFSQAERETEYQLFQTGLTTPAQIDSTFTDIFLTFTFRI